MRHAPLYWLLVVFALPLAAAWTLWFQPQWRPAGSHHGELIQPPVQVGVGHGWILAVPAPEGCTEACTETMQLLQRVRRALGVEARRVQPMACTPSGAEDPCAGLAAVLGEGTALVIIDPMGNAVLRYGRDFSPLGLLDDLERLLRLSRHWRNDGGH